jgi:hypothetical protein
VSAELAILLVLSELINVVVPEELWLRRRGLNAYQLPDKLAPFGESEIGKLFLSVLVQGVHR